MKISLTLICILLPYLTHSQNCTNVYSFWHSTCIFYFNSQQDCQNVSFSFCTWQTCLSQRTSQNQDCLETFQTKSASWDQCTSNCCDSSISYSQSWDSVQKCQTYLTLISNESSGLSAVLLATAILMGVIGLLCICYCCRSGILVQCCRPIKHCLASIMRCKCCKNVREVNDIDHNISQEGLPGSKESKQVQKQQSQWVYLSPFEAKQCVQEITCCICLQNRPTLELECGHKFHKLCIKECLKKKKQCPLCRTTKINKIHLYCESCFRSYLCSTLVDYFANKICLSYSCPNCIRIREIKN